jgi:hypothetical protein
MVVIGPHVSNYDSCFSARVTIADELNDISFQTRPPKPSADSFHGFFHT